jgi:hypothetical protein
MQKESVARIVRRDKLVTLQKESIATIVRREATK